MAYDGANLHLLKDLIGGLQREWFYRSTDTLATVVASGYFAAGTQRGLKRGDQIHYVKTDTFRVYSGYVSNVDGSGNATVVLRESSGVTSTSAATSDATAGNRTYTAAEILGGTIVRDCAGGSRSDVLPTAALLVAAINGAQVGDTINCLIVNGSDAAEVITIGAGTGGGFDTNQTAASRVIPQNASKFARIRLTNVTAASEAYVVYL